MRTVFFFSIRTSSLNGRRKGIDYAIPVNHSSDGIIARTRRKCRQMVNRWRIMLAKCACVCVCVCWYTMLPKSHTCAASKPGAALRPPVVIRHSRCNDPILSLLFRRRATQAFETMARCSVPCTAGTTRRHTMPTWWSSVPDPVDTSPPSKLPSSA